MTRNQILETIKEKMETADGGVYGFIDWLQEFIENELKKP